MGLNNKQLDSIENINILVGKSFQGFIPSSWPDPQADFPITLNPNNYPNINFNKGYLSIGLGDHQYVTGQVFINPCDLSVNNNAIRLEGAILLFDNNTYPILSGTADQYSTIISSKNSGIAPGIKNTVILGGEDILAGSNNSVYVPKLNIKNLPFEIIDICDYSDSLYNVNDQLYWNGNIVISGTAAIEYTGSWYYILGGQTVNINERKQWVLYNEIIIEGELINEGILVIFDTPNNIVNQYLEVNFTNQSVLNINHNFTRYPTITVINTIGDVIDCLINHDSNKINSTLYFSGTVSGTVYLS